MSPALGFAWRSSLTSLREIAQAQSVVICDEKGKILQQRMSSAGCSSTQKEIFRVGKEP
jgi:hypothetical protein